MEPSSEERKTHQANLFEKLNRDRREAKLTCDLTLKSEGRAIPVHKNILMVSSEFFKNMFTVEMMERYSDGIEMQIPHQRLVNIIDFIYTGRIEITEENVLDILDDAEYTQILALKEHCSKFLLHSAAMTQNCLMIRAYAQRYHLDAVIQKCNGVIRNNFDLVMKLEDVLELSIQDFTTVIKLKTPEGEESAFEGILRWVKHNLAKREEMFADLFSLLNLNALNHRSLSNLSHERLVKESLICSNKLVNAFVNLNASEEILLIGNDESETKCELFDFKTKRSKTLMSLLNKRTGSSSVRVGKLVYTTGGAKKSFEMFNLGAMQRWNELPNMLEERTWCDSAYHNSLIFVTGGWNNNKKVLSACEVFDINYQTWSWMCNMQQKRYFHKSVVCQGVLYSIGGFDGENHLSSCESYDEANKCWKNAASLTEARSCFACVEFDGTIYVVGGNNAKNILASVEKYVPETNKWENVASLRSERTACLACVIRDKILVMGGRNDSGKNLRSVEAYDPYKDVWEVSFEMDNPITASSIVAV